MQVSSWNAVAVIVLIITTAVSIADARDLGVNCGGDFAFDSSSVRREGDMFSDLSATDGTTAPGATSVTISSFPADLPSSTSRVCTAAWHGPAAPFSLAYVTATGDDDAPNPSGNSQRSYREALHVESVTLIVHEMNDPECVPVVSNAPGAVLEAAATASEINASAWQMAAMMSQARRVDLSNGLWALPLTPSDGVSTRATTIPNPTIPLTVALPKVGCSVKLGIYTRARSSLVWFMWVFPVVITALCWGVQICFATCFAAPRIDGAVDGTALLATVVAGYVAVLTNAIGLALASGIDEPGWGYTPTLPLAPATTLFLCSLLASWAVHLFTLWRLYERRLVLSLVLRLAEQTLALAMCAGMLYRGFFILGVTSLLVNVVGGALYAHTFGTMAELLPTDLVRFVPAVLTSAMWAPFLLPVAPMLCLYGPLFVGTRRGEATSYVVRVFDVLVATRAPLLTSLPHTILGCLMAALHQGYAPLLLLYIVVMVWSNTLGIRRFARLQRSTGLEFIAGCPSLWDTVADAIDDAVYGEQHASVSRDQTKRAEKTLADFSAARKRVARETSPGRGRFAGLDPARLAPLYKDESTGDVYVQERGVEPSVQAVVESQAQRDREAAELDDKMFVMHELSAAQRNRDDYRSGGAGQQRKALPEDRGHHRGSRSHTPVPRTVREDDDGQFSAKDDVGASPSPVYASAGQPQGPPPLRSASTADERWSAVGHARPQGGRGHSAVVDAHGDELAVDQLYPDVVVASPSNAVSRSMTPAMDQHPPQQQQQPPRQLSEAANASRQRQREDVSHRQYALLRRHERRHPSPRRASPPRRDVAQDDRDLRGPQPVNFTASTRGFENGGASRGGGARLYSPSPRPLTFPTRAYGDVPRPGES